MKKTRFLLAAMLCAGALSAQVLVLSNQTFTTPKSFSNMDTLIITGCTFENITGDALLFENIDFVAVENCIFRNITNTVGSRGAVCGRTIARASLKNLHFYDITGTAIRFPKDGAVIAQQRCGNVLIDSVNINGTRTNSTVYGTGIQIYHTDTVVIQNSSLKNIAYHAILLGRNSTAIQNDQRINYCHILSNRIDSVAGDGISAQENVWGAVVRHNHISNIAFDGIGARPTEGDHGMYWQAPDAVIENNRVYNVRDGLVSGNPGSGISLRTNALVNANEINQCTGNGIGYFNDHPGSGVLLIANNLIYDNDQNGIYINGSNGNILDPASVRHPDTVLIYNNTVLNQALQNQLIHSCPIALNNMSSYNEVAGNLCVFEDITDTTQYVRFVGNTPSKNTAYNFLGSGDPGFVHVEQKDFRLNGDSEARDFIPSGISFVANDLTGLPRFGAHDAGAYEYQVVSNNPIPAVKTGRKAYPVPFQDHLSILNLQGHESLALMDAQGRTMWSGAATDRIYTANLPAGCYFLMISDETGIETIRVYKY